MSNPRECSGSHGMTTKKGEPVAPLNLAGTPEVRTCASLGSYIFDGRKHKLQTYGRTINLTTRGDPGWASTEIGVYDVWWNVIWLNATIGWINNWWNIFARRQFVEKKCRWKKFQLISIPSFVWMIIGYRKATWSDCTCHIIRCYNFNCNHTFNDWQVRCLTKCTCFDYY